MVPTELVGGDAVSGASSSPLPNAATLLSLMWLASPALPVGGFSYSEVLETAVECGRVGTEVQTSAWLKDQLQLSLARCELPLVAQAIWAWRETRIDRLRVLNEWALVTRESSELRQQSQQMGRSMTEWLKNQVQSDGVSGSSDPCVQQLERLEPSPTWQMAFALAAHRSGAPVREALLSFSFGWAENMVQAALKAVPLGQSAGQRVLAMLCAEIPGAVEHAINLPDHERQAHSPMLAILSAQHETQYSRLFRS